MAAAGGRILAPRVTKLVDFLRTPHDPDLWVDGCGTENTRRVLGWASALSFLLCQGILVQRMLRSRRHGALVGPVRNRKLNRFDAALLQLDPRARGNGGAHEGLGEASGPAAQRSKATSV